MLRPTRIYVDAVNAAKAVGDALHGAAHITGGGLLENPQRALADDLAVELDLSALRPPPILRAIAAQGVPHPEMLRTFNCGVGMILYVDPDAAAAVTDALTAQGEIVTPIGVVAPRGDADAPQVRIRGDVDLFDRS
ncbi:MAG: AIR synthase-related protein [Nannocystaceae bacterium]